MSTPTPLLPVHVPQGKGCTLCAFGDTATLHLTGAETGGRFTMFTTETLPGNGPPPHVHAEEDETFYVLEGRVEFWKESGWFEAPVGSVVFMPRRVPHTFRNAGDRPSRILITTSPSGFETFFSRCAEVFKEPEVDMARIVKISSEHGIEYLKP